MNLDIFSLRYAAALRSADRAAERVQYGKRSGVNLGLGPIREGLRDALGDKIGVNFDPLVEDGEVRVVDPPTPTQAASASNLRDIVRGVFKGHPSVDYDNGLGVGLPGRRLLRVHTPDYDRTAHIDFFNDVDPDRKGADKRAVSSGKRVREGTFDFVRHLSQLASKLHAEDYAVSYTAPSDRRRSRLYSHALTRAGFIPDAPTGDRDYYWRPKNQVPEDERAGRLAAHANRLAGDTKTPERLGRAYRDALRYGAAEEKAKPRFVAPGEMQSAMALGRIAEAAYRGGQAIEYVTPSDPSVAANSAKAMEKAGFERDTKANGNVERWVPTATPGR
ncbi:hypothetical protein [Limnoglobus roseus]|uniref:Uncharacterized protein n=1 Tax=Limnoglobus roseus TaxID=2598579 RepID=A0A5C1AB44_9BACT|nr:hypothetical protein [Limnoglobus roseus]QEL14248.1 hypothetical protein PX52LOC_01118 [Limnoglobus roseus]